MEPAHLVFGGSSPVKGPSAGDLDLPFRLARQHAVATFERLYLLSQLRRHKGRITLVAQHAGITPKHVRELMKRHGISRRDFRPPLRRQLVAAVKGQRPA